MTDSRLFTVLKILSPEEFKRLRKFLLSPFYNSNEHIVKLYGLLRKYYPAFDHPSLQQEKIFTKLFPGEPFKSERLRLIQHRFANLVEQFIVAQELKENAYLNKKLLTRSLGDRNAYALFEKNSLDLIDTLEQTPYRGINFYRDKKNLILQLYGHPVTNRQKRGLNSIHLAMEALDNYFVLSKLRLACAVRARERTLSEKYSIRFLEEVLDYENDGILIQVYARLLELQDKDDLQVFEEIKDLFTKNIQHIELEDKRNILQLLLNFCTRMLNRGAKQMNRNTLDLYKLGIEQDFIMINNEMNQFVFSNIVVMGVVNEEYNWTALFIKNHAQYLDAQDRGNAVNYSWAFWHFYQKNYDDCLSILLNYSFSSSFRILSRRGLLVRTYIELYLQDDSYYDMVLAQLNSFEKYIRNNQPVSDTANRGYLNFMKYAKKMINLRSRKKDLTDLREKIRIDENIVMKQWLLSKFEMH